MNKISLQLLLASFIFLCGSVSAAPILIVNDEGLLVGARGLMVGEFRYNVSFEEGSCNELFDGCQSFSFHNFGDGIKTVSALLEDVFLDYGTVNFGLPKNIRGCEDDLVCFVMTPYQTHLYNNGALLVDIVATEIWGTSRPDTYETITQGLDFNSLNGSRFVYAVWSEVSNLPEQEVPEPSSLFLLGIGLLGLAIAHKKVR